MSVAEAASAEAPGVLAANPDWWRGAVIYQIYPRSFQDTNGDGIGDLPGITERLPYVASIGVDAVWISPFFTSPMLDHGYDVSDHRDVDPTFGALEDFDALVAAAHRLGLRVMTDLVLSHTSSQHPWFRESMADRTNPKADWYVWADPKPDGTPPNNWLSVFGGPAWEWDGARMQYYLHNFLREQPDLNFHNAEVQDAALDVARFWLQRGVDGFRLDTVNFYVHDAELRDNPPLSNMDVPGMTAPSVNPYGFQSHVHDKSRPENVAFLRRLRAVMDGFRDIASVGEVGDDQRGLEIQAEYTQGRELLHMCYGFDFLSARRPTGDRIAEVLERFQRIARNGWACWAFSNHDVVRHTTRWSLSPEAHRTYLAVLLSLRGSVCLYQGEELGLNEADVAFEDLHDPYGIRFWPAFKGRDGCRTPMVWHARRRHGGFSDARPWLPVASEHAARAVDAQERDPDSMLGFYRRMIAYRASRPELVKGAFDVVEADEGFLSAIRTHGGNRLFTAFNLSERPREVILPAGAWTADRDSPFDAGDGAVLPPWQATFKKAG